MVRKWHRYMGLVLILPFLGWSVTGLIFFIKPGYAGAFAMPSLKTYPLEAPPQVPEGVTGMELRFLRTVLGNHLLVKDTQGWRHLDPATGQPMTAPEGDRLKALLEDAMAADPRRYGAIQSLGPSSAVTDTGVRLTLHWETLGLSQKGEDTDLINRLYDIHYLRWTGVKGVDQVLGVAGLVLLMAMTASGIVLLSVSFRGISHGSP